MIIYYIMYKNNKLSIWKTVLCEKYVDKTVLILKSINTFEKIDETISLLSVDDVKLFNYNGNDIIFYV